MTAPNSRANGSATENPNEMAVQTVVLPAMMRASTGPQFSPNQIQRLIAELEVLCFSKTSKCLSGWELYFLS